ncbi:hypothetical protein BD779DRAFT_1477913 [Infundibulicybe gibba]|nr:hypothetical protein BD779DRAFT_1477913 [Infundibulicybe gibba]
MSTLLAPLKTGRAAGTVIESSRIEESVRQPRDDEDSDAEDRRFLEINLMKEEWLRWSRELIGSWFYVVVVGRRTGIFRDWDTAKPFVAGVSNNQHKSFSTIVDAREYWDDYCRANHTHGPPQAVPSPYGTPQNLSPSSSPPTIPNRSIRLSNTPESGPQAMGSGQLFYVVRPVNPRSLGAAIYSNRSAIPYRLMDAY